MSSANGIAANERAITSGRGNHSIEGRTGVGLNDADVRKTSGVVELLVGRVLEANDHPGARAPSYLLRLDLGSRGEIEAQMEPGGHAKEELLGTFVVVSFGDEAIVVCARSHAHGPVLLRPDRDVEPGTIVA